MNLFLFFLFVFFRVFEELYQGGLKKWVSVMGPFIFFLLINLIEAKYFPVLDSFKLGPIELSSFEPKKSSLIISLFICWSYALFFRDDDRFPRSLTGMFLALVFSASQTIDGLVLSIVLISSSNIFLLAPASIFYLASLLQEKAMLSTKLIFVLAILSIAALLILRKEKQSSFSKIIISILAVKGIALILGPISPHFYLLFLPFALLITWMQRTEEIWPVYLFSFMLFCSFSGIAHARDQTLTSYYAIAGAIYFSSSFTLKNYASFVGNEIDLEIRSVFLLMTIIIFAPFSALLTGKFLSTLLDQTGLLISLSIYTGLFILSLYHQLSALTQNGPNLLKPRLSWNILGPLSILSLTTYLGVAVQRDYEKGQSSSPFILSYFLVLVLAVLWQKRKYITSYYLSWKKG